MGKTTYYERPKRMDKLSKEDKISLMFDLINSIKIVRNPTDVSLFLQDLLTANEIKNISVRLRIAKLLLAGIKQRDVAKITHSSLVTVSKISIWLQKGGEGFKKVISQLPHKYAIPKNLPHGPIEYHLPELLAATAQWTIASKQNKDINKFLEGINEKKLFDKEMREMASEHYRK